MKEPSPMPDAVIESVHNSFPVPWRAWEILVALQWSGDHYYFMLGTMYVGIEIDGYMHT